MSRSCCILSGRRTFCRLLEDTIRVWSRHSLLTSSTDCRWLLHMSIIWRVGVALRPAVLISWLWDSFSVCNLLRDSIPPEQNKRVESVLKTEANIKENKVCYVTIECQLNMYIWTIEPMSLVWLSTLFSSPFVIFHKLLPILSTHGHWAVRVF